MKPHIRGETQRDSSILLDTFNQRLSKVSTLFVMSCSELRKLTFYYSVFYFILNMYFKSTIFFPVFYLAVYSVLIFEIIFTFFFYYILLHSAIFAIFIFF